MHICVSKLTIIGSNDGLSPGQHQAIIWINAGILLIRTLGTSEILSKIHAIWLKKTHLKMSSAKLWQFFPVLTLLQDGLDSLTHKQLENEWIHTQHCGLRLWNSVFRHKNLACFSITWTMLSCEPTLSIHTFHCYEKQNICTCNWICFKSRHDWHFW